jgi:hypothetical protein
MKDQILAVISPFGVDKDSAKDIEACFLPFVDQLKEWEERAKLLVVTEAGQAKEMQQAREGRLVLKDIRVGADKLRKQMKEDSLKYGNAVQSVYNYIESAIKPIEAHLYQQENFVRIQVENAEKELSNARLQELQPYVEFVAINLDFGKMPETDYQNLLNGARLLLEQKKKAETEQRERAAKEAAEKQAAQELIRIENERLKAEAIQREKELATEREKQRIENERLKAEANAEREKLRLIEEKQNAENARVKAENEQRAKEAAEAQAAPDRLKADGYFQALLDIDPPIVSPEIWSKIAEVRNFIAKQRANIT